MPLMLSSPKSITMEINAIKVVSSPNDNDLNTTVLYPYEGSYDADTKVFTPIRPMDEHLLDQATYAGLMVRAKAHYDEYLTSDPMGIYEAQKVIMYEFLAEQIKETGYTVI
jgi:hypothetical protein